MTRLFSTVSTLLLASLLVYCPSLHAGGYNISACREVHTVIEDPFPMEGEDAPEMVAEIVCKKIQDLAPIFGVRVHGRMVRLMIPESMESFHKMTGKGKYTLAVFSPRIGIVTQPAKTLQSLHDTKRLEQTLTHELTHFFIFKVAGFGVPSWLHEGLAQWFEGLHPKQGIIMSTDDIMKMEVRFHMPNIPIAQRSRDYEISLMLVAKIIRRAGRDKLIESLRDIHEYPDALDLPVAGRTIRQWLLSADEPVADEDGAQESQLEILRGEDWKKRLEEEFDQGGDNARTRGFDGQDEGEISPLPIEQLLKKAKQKKKAPQHPKP